MYFEILQVTKFKKYKYLDPKVRLCNKNTDILRDLWDPTLVAFVPLKLFLHVTIVANIK